ncbi:MAG: hypothetical protein JNL80_11230 [Phycisphaerae bacterium]|jgi:WD40 repeat protein|nr:hypothetical protein [Phycisphaerae bacterium]
MIDPRALCLPSIFLAALASAAHGQERVTFVDHVRPIFAQRCLQCHNPDKLKGDLDLTTFAGVMTGGSGGAVVAPGNADGSALVGVIAHTREPKMPPKGDRIAEAEIATIRAWVAGGCLETSSSAAAQPKPAISLGAGPAMAAANLSSFHLPMVSREPTARAPIARAMAALPGSSVVALSGRREVLLYARSGAIEGPSDGAAVGGILLGALPTGEDEIEALRFTRDGRFLLASAGVGGKNGCVWIWSMPTGSLVTRVGEEVDAVLAADLDAKRSRVALGGPQRVVKVISVADGTVTHRIRKHTDWITAIAYSPDGVLLATADRAGGMHVWEAETLAPYLSLVGHTARVTAIDWSADGNVLVSSSEDGRVRLWSMQDGALAKEWTADPQGVLDVRVTSDSRIVTAGRERTIKMWDAAGSLQRTFPVMPEVAVAAVALDEPSQPAAQVVGADLGGGVTFWASADGSERGRFATAPATLANREAHAKGDLAKRSILVVEREATASSASTQLATSTSAHAEAAKHAAEAGEAKRVAIATRDAASGTAGAAKAALDVATAAKQAATEALAAATGAVEGSIARLKSEVDVDAAAQAALVAAESERVTTERAADEAAKAAAAKDDPALRSAAEAASAAKSVALERAGQARTRANESSATLRAALEATEKAKAAVPQASETRDKAEREATAAAEVLAVANGTCAAAEEALAAAESRATFAEAEVALQAGYVARDSAALTTAQAALTAARNDVMTASAIVARCEAGRLRERLDRERVEYASAVADAEPYTTARATAESAAARAAAALDAAEAELANAPKRCAEAIAMKVAAERERTDADAAVVTATTRLKEREAEQAAFNELVLRLTTSASAAPGDAALAAACARAREALDQMALSQAHSRKQLDDAVLAAAAAAERLRSAGEAVVLTERDAGAIPTRIEGLRSDLSHANDVAAAAVAAAELAMMPAEAIAERVAKLEAEYGQATARY